MVENVEIIEEMNAWDRKLKADKVKAGVLGAAMKIVKQSGWNALSMRKIALEGNYSPSAVYSCFKTKNLLLNEFTRQGYSLLYREIAEASTISRLPELRLAHMWQAYWHFAMSHEQYYRLMFGIGTASCTLSADYPESKCFIHAFKSTIAGAIKRPGFPEEMVTAKLFSYWSVVHGLICLNLEKQSCTTLLNDTVLVETMNLLSSSFSQFSESDHRC